jgi:hypothetical protein
MVRVYRQAGGIPWRLQSHAQRWHIQRRERTNQTSIPDYVDGPVEELLSEIEAAWNRGDLHAYAALYTRDAAT